jgi:protein TonB
MDPDHRLRGTLRNFGLAALGVALVVGLGWLIQNVVSGKDGRPGRKVQVVQVIRPPPPPPEEAPPPPPPKTAEQLPQDQAEPEPSNEPAPTQQLGLDTDGVAGGDAFGLAAHKGGHEITGTGQAVFAWYTGMLKERVLDTLSDDRRMRAKHFSVVVRVWVASDGTVKDARLASTSGNHETDAAIESALGNLGRLREAPPLEMPQPVTLRVVSRS